MRKFYLLTILFVSYSIFTNAQTKTQVLVDIHATMGDFISDLNNAGDVSDNDRHQAIYNMDVTFGSPEYFMYNGKQRGSLQSWLQSYFKDNIRDVDVQHTLTIKEQSLVKKDVNNHSDKRWSFEGTLERNYLYQGKWVSVPSESVSLTVVWNGENKYVSIVALDGQLRQLSHVEDNSEKAANYQKVSDKQSYNKLIEYDFKSSFDSEGLWYVEKDKKCGFIDEENNIVIPIIYNDAHFFNEGLAAVKKDKKWGFIDKENNIVIPFMYEEVENYKDGWARVKKDKKWGFIDKENNIVIPCIYEYVSNFDEDGTAWVKMNGKYGYIDRYNNCIVPFIYESTNVSSGGLVIVEKNEKYGAITKNNNIVIPCIYEYVSNFDEGLWRVKKNKKWGVVDKNNNIVVPIIYERMDDVREGLARVRVGKKWGFIDKENNIVIPCMYEMVGDFREGLAKVRVGKKWGFIDKENNIVIPIMYESAYPFEEDGTARVWVDDKQSYLINKYGEIIKRDKW